MARGGAPAGAGGQQRTNNNQLPPLSSLYRQAGGTPPSAAAKMDPTSSFFNPFPAASSAPTASSSAAAAASNGSNPFSTGDQAAANEASLRSIQRHQIQQYADHLPQYLAQIHPNVGYSAAGTSLTPGNNSKADGDEEMELEEDEDSRRGSVAAGGGKGRGKGGDQDSVTGEKDSKKRKRNRTALSCSECKRRKIKCDRKIPCESCIRRGESATCHWEDRTAEPSPQPFALAYDVEYLIRRLAQLEAAVTHLPPDLLPSGWQPMPQPTQDQPGDMGEPPPVGSVLANITPPPLLKPLPATDPSTATGSRAGTASRPIVNVRPAGRRGAGGNAAAGAVAAGATASDLDSEDEDAALVLEELALGKPRTASVYQPATTTDPATSQPSAPAPAVEPTRRTSGRLQPGEGIPKGQITPAYGATGMWVGPLSTAGTSTAMASPSKDAAAGDEGLSIHSPPRGLLAASPETWGATLDRLACSATAMTSVSYGSLTIHSDGGEHLLNSMTGPISTAGSQMLGGGGRADALAGGSGARSASTWLHKSLARSMLGILPNKELSLALIDVYFERKSNPALTIYPEPYFRKTHEDLWRIIEHEHRRAHSAASRGGNGGVEETDKLDDDVEKIDPLWLAGYFEVIALAAFTNDPATAASGRMGPVVGTGGDKGQDEGSERTGLPGVGKTDLAVLAKTWLEGAELAMFVGEWTMKPRARALQAILCMFPTLQFMSSNKSEAMDRYLIWLAGGIRLATLMGLHRLGPDEENKMPPDDPAWPPGENCLKRELAKRLWHGLCFADAMTGSYIQSKVDSLLTSDFWDTPLPANVDDSELGLHPRVVARPLEEVTELSVDLFKYRLGMQQRLANEATAQGKHPTYQQILDLDAGFRSITDAVPLVFRPSAATSDESPLLTQRRRAMEQSLCYRLLRLHRRYVHRGLRDPRYRKSVETCQWAAKRIMMTHMWPTPTRPFVHYFALLHLLNAVSIMAVIAFGHIDRWTAESNAQAVCESIISDMETAASSYREYSHQMHQTIVQAAEQTESIILRLASEIRGSMERARDAARSGGPRASTETLSTVVRRMAESFADDPSGSRTSSSPRDATSQTPSSIHHPSAHGSSGSPSGTTPHSFGTMAHTASTSSVATTSNKNPPHWFAIGPEMTSPMTENPPSPSKSGPGGFHGFERPEDIAQFLSTFAYGNPVAAAQNPMSMMMPTSSVGGLGAGGVQSGANVGQPTMAGVAGPTGTQGPAAESGAAGTAGLGGLDWTSMFSSMGEGEWPSWESMAF